jgi:hypothetical protein
MFNHHTCLSLRVAARGMLAEMGSLQFAIASDLLRVLSRVPNYLSIEEAHTVSMEVCQHLETCLLYGDGGGAGAPFLWARERINTEDGGTQGRNNTPTIDE